MAGGASSRMAPTVEVEGRARAERTRNMYLMSVTLDVSRLSGWLNADGTCRVKKRSIRRRGDMWAGWREVWAGRGTSSAQESPDCGG